MCLFSYIQFSAVCARTLRRCLKSSVAKDALKREESYVRVNKWQGGKLTDQVYPASKEVLPLTSSLISMSYFSFSFIETEQSS